MLKKLLTFMMVAAIFVVNANAASQKGLKAAFDELNYALTVEWDQKDKDFYSTQMKKFMSVVSELQSQGMTNAQLIEFVKSEAKDEKVAKDLETAFNMVQINKMSSAEATKYMVDTMKKSYSSGASWNGEVLIYAAIGLLIVAAAIAIASGSHGGASGSYYGGGYYCTQYYVCDTYYDPYYGYYDDCYYTCY